MTLRKWLYLFFTTLGIGGGVAVITGLAMDWQLFTGAGIPNLLVGIAGNFWVGLMYSAVSQMGFFAFLTLNQFGIGIFRRKETWNVVLMGLILFVFFDFVYLRYQVFGQAGNWLPFVWLPSLLLAFSVVVAYLKMKETNRSAFIPAVFFMFAVTIIEWFPALRENNVKSMIFMLLPLLACNSWQLMILHRLTKDSPNPKAVQMQKS